MTKPLSPATFFFSVIVLTMTLMSVTVLMPQDKYYRYQEYHSGTTRKADWIYERLNFDESPIDVALLGSSRTGAGLSAPDIETYFCKATGRKISVANLSIPETGRNMHYVLAKELFATKSPTLVVLELNERETRRPHNDFIYLADAEDVLSAPLWINLNYFSDLLRLPGRQATLFWSSLTKRPALRQEFDDKAYAGRHLDRTRTLELLDGRIINRQITLPKEKLDAMHDMRIATSFDHVSVPTPIKTLEHRISRHYVRKIDALAQTRNAKLTFALLPAYRRPNLEEDVLGELGVEGEIALLGDDLANNPAYWQDAIHLNTSGALLASERFALALAKTHPGLGILDEHCK